MKYLAFDLGAESGRAVLGDLSDGRLTLQEVHRFSNEPVQVIDLLHWDVLGQFRELLKGLQNAIAKAGSLAGIGVDTWGVDFGLIGSDGTLLANPVHYRDDRTKGVMEKVFEVVPKSDIFDVTGLQFMQFNTIYQLYAMKLEASPILEVAQTMLLMPDLFNYMFTGIKRTEYSIASTTQLLDARTGGWAVDLIDRLGLPKDLFAQIVPPGTIIGSILPSIAAYVGVDNPDSVKVIAPAGHDTGSAVAAVPARGDNHAYISCGTWSLMGIEVPRPIIDERISKLNMTNEGAVGGIRLLKNIMGLWLVQECRRVWVREGESLGYDEITRMAMDAPALESFVVPNDDSFLKPDHMPKAIQAYCARTGQSIPDSKGAIVRCALESLALTYRWTLDRLNEVTGKRLDVVHMVGGGTQNRLLCQLAADAMGVPVLAGPVEATAIGNIMVQAMAVGEVDSLATARECVQNSFPLIEYIPDATRRARWDDVYGKFEALMV